MSVDDRTVRDALSRVKYPGFTRDIVSFGIVKDVSIDGSRVALRIQLPPGNPAVASAIERDLRAELATIEGIAEIAIDFLGPRAAGLVGPGAPLPMAGRETDTPRLDGRGALHASLTPGVRHIVAVASGKGGVGKSTIAVNLAVALARRGVRTGLLDADVYGPSIPLMMGVDARPDLVPGGHRLVPFERFGVRFMSLGFLLDPGTAVIWRGPMVMKAVEQLLADVDWGEIDVLIVDMPPGTGDAQLTLAQRARLDGAVVVTTPQDVALADAVKAIDMFRKVDVPVLGIIENMSFFCCPQCGARSEIFGHGGGRRTAGRFDVPFLAEIAIDSAIRDGGDAGRPIVESAPDSDASRAFLEAADDVFATLSRNERGGDALGWMKGWTGD